MSSFIKIMRIIGEVRADLCEKLTKIDVLFHNFHKSLEALIYMKSFSNKNCLSQIS